MSMNIMSTIHETNIFGLRLQLSTKTNRELLSRFKLDFKAMSTYAPENKDDKLHILEYSKSFIDEFKGRVQNGSNNSILEFAIMIQSMMKVDPIGGESYYTRNLIRLYSYCIKLMELKGIPYKELKAKFL